MLWLVVGAALTPGIAHAHPAKPGAWKATGDVILAKPVRREARKSTVRQFARASRSKQSEPALPGDFGAKVDATLARIADRSAADRSIRVVVYGEAPVAALERVRATSIDSMALVNAASGTIKAAHLRRLGGDAGVSHVTVDSPVERTDSGSGSVTSLITPLVFPDLTTLYPKIDGAPAAWNKGYSGKGIGIAVIDSGVTPVADFGTRVTQVRLSFNGETLNDGYGHGTFVAGVAGGKSLDGRYVGVAPGASIYALNVARGQGVFSSDVIAGLDWVDANRGAKNIRVVVLSLGETLPSSYTTNILDAAVERLWKNGVTVVVSAGNSGPDTAQYAPANDPFAITVGASDPVGTLDKADDVVASFSTYGQTLDGFTKPDLVTPGRHIVAPVPTGTTLDQIAPPENHVLPGYLRMNGTSFSAPQVAGAAAILLEKNPGLKPDQVKWLLVQTGGASVAATPGRRLDLEAAITYSGTIGFANQGVEYSVALSSSGSGSGGLNSASTSAEALIERAEAWNRIALDRQAKLGTGVTLKKLQKVGAAFEQSGAYYNRSRKWAEAARAWANAAATWEKAAAFDAATWELAAAAWDIAGGSFNMAATSYSSAATWEAAASAYASAAAAWTSFGSSAKATVSLSEQRLALRNAATWEAATWENAATWEAAATWESAATWENAGDWESSDDDWG